MEDLLRYSQKLLNVHALPREQTGVRQVAETAAGAALTKCDWTLPSDLESSWVGQT